MVSNKAFVLLILENNWKPWLEIYQKNNGNITPMKGCRKQYLDCDILPKYTHSGAMPGSQAEHAGDLERVGQIKVFNDSPSYLTM